ncbi:MAG: 16S rRNA (adenine(1518)-N(6)/adenine(1519)-N(6))-dimethyltransferase RsmA [Bacilli bacterium]|nr:16S rRNA (adenine(1518)-N(6)/adenine(1519)-N(6))-dimethyltransferase RsmA [Bacilli bacterium]
MENVPKKVLKLVDNYEFKFKKKFGQNFIIDDNIIQSIVNKTDIDKETLVIEIGPGAGSLTAALGYQAKRVIAYEIDETLKEILNEQLSGYDNIDIIYTDFLRTNLKETLKNYEYSKLYVVANLPYYITTPIILKLIEEDIAVDKIVVMVQKEVGDRFKAKIGTKDYSSLTVYLNYYFDIKKIMDVSKNVFVPKPNVDSIVVEFVKKNNQLLLKNDDLFFKLVRDSFKQKRKTIKNNLKDYPLDKIEVILKKYNHDLNVRAEQITLDEFVQIANFIS